MSLFIAGAIAGASLIAGLLIAVSEQIRAASYRRRVSASERPPAAQAVRIANTHRKSEFTKSTLVKHDATESLAKSRAAAYHEILDALGDDLDQDIAEWEAVLQDFPQVIGVADLCADDDLPTEPAVETEIPRSDSITPQHRTRRVSAEERGMIQRLLRTGFAPEEIALWLNLPLERVQEFLLRDGLI